MTPQSTYGSATDATLVDRSATSAVVLHRPHVTWISIVGGWLVAMGIAWLFYLLGLAVGFSSFDVNDADAVAKGIGIGTTVWIILTWAVSLFLGGMFASWVDGRADGTVGALHGVAVWGLALTITAILTALGVSNFLQGTASLIGRGAAAAGAAGAAVASRQGTPDTPFAHATGLLGAQIDRAVAQGPARTGASQSAAPSPTATSPAGSTGTAATGATASDTNAGSNAATSSGRPVTSMDADSRAAIALDLLRGKNDDAKARLMASGGLQSSDADAALQSLSPQVERLKAQVKEAAEQARRYSAAALWAAFLSGLIALIAAALGGSMGASHIHRVHDGRRF